MQIRSIICICDWACRAELIEDVQEKIRGLSLFMKNQTGREFNINEEMASTVKVIKVVISEFTAKSRLKA